MPLFQKGNEFWKLAEKVGKPPLFSSPMELAEVAQRYFQWCYDNPLPMEGVYGKDPQIVTTNRIRAFTLAGLCNFANMSIDTWYNMAKKPEYLEVCASIKQIMFQQKFEGAAAGLLHPNIIARDLGLVDRKEVEATHAQKVVLYVPDNNRTIAAPPTRDLEEGEEFDLLESPDNNE